MTKTKTRSWDAAEHLETEEDMSAYTGAVLIALPVNNPPP